jgi:hypothetical protein
MGYDLILDKRNVPYVKSTYDVTNEIIVRCGGTLNTPKVEPDATNEKLEQPAKINLN